MAQALTKIQTGMISQQAQQALQGQTGATGATGLRGLQGDSGPQGIQGDVGATGPVGASGVSVTGATGPQGVQGVQGERGPSGLQGLQGDVGSTGSTGPVGASGVQGPSGLQGLQGDIGSTGATGVQGATGLGDKYQTYSTTSLTIGNGTQSLYVEPGLAYTQNQPVIISHTNGAEHMHGVVNGYDKIGGGLSVAVSTHTGSGTFSAWTVNLEGAVGAVGATGLTGASGAQGVPGAQGATGVQGNAGATGVQGDVGATGLQGVQGVPGAQGATGVQGDVGATGAQGVQGSTGVMGPSGAQGVQGVAGEIGASGATGPSGAQGATGVGSTGATGLSGDKYTTSSTNSLSLTTGSKSLTVAADLALSVGQDVILAYDANNRMEGTISAYNSTTGALTVNVTHVLAGSGTYTSWAISLAGAVGQVGATGATGPAAPLFGGGVLSPRFTGNGSSVAFGPLEGWDGPMNDEAGYLVYIDGVFQRPDEVNGGFTITGTDYASSQINFPSAIANGSVVDVLAIQVSGARGATGIQGATGPAGSGGGGDVGKAWNALVQYLTGDIVSYNGIAYVALVDNINHSPVGAFGSDWQLAVPDIAGKAWSSSVTYATGDVVSYNGVAYVALQSTTNNQPDSSPVYWQTAVQVPAQIGGREWDATLNYLPGDVVGYADQLYICINQSVNNYPSGNAYYWKAINGVAVASSGPNSDGGLASAGVTVAGWIDVVIGGNTYKMPYFQ